MKNKVALITGITGFVGSHMAEYLLNQGYEVHGITRWRSKTDNIKHLIDTNQVTLHEGDVKDMASLMQILVAVDPAEIYHLAAQSYVPASHKSPNETMNINVLGTLNLLEAVRKTHGNPRIQIAGSSEEYGLVHPNEVPITEDNPLRPLSPYGVSKVAADMIGWQYFRSYGVWVIRTRAFNHTGPRRGEVFVTSNFAKQIVDIEKGNKPPMIQVGNLDASRDFTDVRDIVRGYHLALQKGVPGEVYNLCSGHAIKINHLLQELVTLSKLDHITISHDKERMRPSDVQILEGSYEKFHNQTGWEPKIPFHKTLQDLLDYWRLHK